MKRIPFIAISGVLLLSATAAFAAYDFTGPTQGPTGGNTPGVIWNMQSGTQTGAKIDIDGSAHIGDNFHMNSGKAIRVDSLTGATTLNMGNWGVTQQPFTLNVYGDVKLKNFGATAGQKGRMDAYEYCINGANCITAWPSGGGGGITSIVNGGGLTVTNPSGPTTTLSVIDNYVNTTGDTMSGNLIMNNAYPYVTNLSGYGGYFWGTYGASTRGSGTNGVGIYSFIGSDVTNGYAAYFDANQALGNSYGLFVRGSSLGPAAYFVDAGAVRGVELANASTNLALSVAGNTRLGGVNDTTTVSGTLKLIAPTSKLCLGESGGTPDCRTSWPTGGTPGGTSDGAVQFKSGTTFNGNSAYFTWDNTNNRLLVGTNIPDISSAMTVRGQGMQAISLTANGTNWGIKAEGNARGLVAKSTNGVGIESTGGLGIIAVATGVSQIPSYLDAAGTFRHMNNNKYTYIGTRTNDEIYTQGNIHLDGYTDPLTYGNLILPASGRVSFNGVLNNTASIQHWNNDFYWNLGTGGNLFIRSAAAASTPFTFRSNGEFHSYGNTSGIYFTQRNSPATREWAWFSDNGYAYLGNNAGWTDKLIVSDNGYLGLGIVPTYQLQLSLNSAAKPTSNVWTVASDLRLKDVHGDYTKGLADIVKLRPILYTYKKNNPYHFNSEELSVGAIAQEVKTVFPEAVKADANGYLQLDTNSINWATINAIKELKTENDKLKAQNASLEWRLKVLEAKVDALLEK